MKKLAAPPRSASKLQLDAQTVRVLTDELAVVAGGRPPTTTTVFTVSKVCPTTSAVC